MADIAELLTHVQDEVDALKSQGHRAFLDFTKVEHALGRAIAHVTGQAEPTEPQTTGQPEPAQPTEPQPAEPEPTTATTASQDGQAQPAS